MTIIRLPNEGDTHTATVKACESVQGTYGQQVKFDFTNGDTLFMPYDSAVRQLARSGFDDGTDEHGEVIVAFADVAGETLTFARTHNKKPGAKPFWDVSVASGAEKRPAAPSKRLPSPTDTRTTGQRILDEAVPPDAPVGANAGPPAHHANVPLEDEPTPTEADAIEAKKHEARQVLAKRYLALWDVVAAHQMAKGKELELPVDGMSANAATATIWITLKDRGLV